MEQVKLVSEATREELEAALAALRFKDEYFSSDAGTFVFDVDPYKPFKDALKKGKRVQYIGHGWRTKDDIPFHWNAPPEMYEIEPEPQRYCGYTLEQWQFVIDGGFDVKTSDKTLGRAKLRGYTYTLISVDTKSKSPFVCSHLSWKYCHIVRRKNHPQPAFGRSVNDDDRVMVYYNVNHHVLLFAEEVIWDEVDWFINFSNEG